MRPIALFTLLALCTTGCVRVEPWVMPHERGNLADSIMSPERHPAASQYLLHVYDAREAGRGAAGAGGGGCGCN